MKCFVLLTVLVFASKNENDIESIAANSGENIVKNEVENSIVVKIEEDDYVKKKSKSSEYIGVHYDENKARWAVKRYSKTSKKTIYNGYYKDQEAAARASDTLARKLMANGEQNLKLNFPDDYSEVHAKERKNTSHYIGVSYYEKIKKWSAQRWGKTEKKQFSNGYYKNEEAAAHASDTLARQLMANGEQILKLNFPNDDTEVHAKEKTEHSTYIGVTYNQNSKQWYTQRWSKTEKKQFTNGTYSDEETAAHASDTLARKLMANGKQNFELNFPNDNTEVHARKYPPKKRKRSFDFDSQTDRDNLEKFEEKEK